MEFIYKIPEHLEGHLGGYETEKLQKIVTLVFEYAIQHRMLDYPKMHIENQVEDILNSVMEEKSSRKEDMAGVMQMLMAINSKVDRLSTTGSIVRDFDSSLMTKPVGGNISAGSGLQIEDEEEFNTPKTSGPANDDEDDDDDDDIWNDVCK